MIERVVIQLAIAGVLAAVAAAAPPKRVVLADADPELRRAVVESLQPWHIEVVIDPGVPADPAEVADRKLARFVVWRDGDELVVFDRNNDQTERRSARAGKLDPVGAAAAALSVKTMMRLPPPPEEPVETTPPPTLLAPTAHGLELRVEVGAGVRASQGHDSNVDARLALAAMIRPWREFGWRFGVLGDAGTGATVDNAGFKGTASDWAVLAIASWTYSAGEWELEPWAAVGVQRTSLDGLEMTNVRTEQSVLATVRAGVVGWRRFGAVSVGAVVGLQGLPSTLTYTKTGTPAEIFEVPAFGLVGGLVAAFGFAP